MEGWIKLHRTILAWEWYQDSNAKSLFIHCILMANIKDSKWKGLEVKRGQFITSYSRLSGELGISFKAVRVAFEKLIKSGCINASRARNGLSVTVCNYNTYQKRDTLEGHTRGTLGADLGQHNKKDKNEKKDKNKESPLTPQGELREFSKEIKEIVNNYPKNVTENEVRESLDSLLKYEKEKIEMLPRAAAEYAEWCRQNKREGQFIKNFKNWIISKGYDNEAEKIEKKNDSHILKLNTRDPNLTLKDFYAE